MAAPKLVRSVLTIVACIIIGCSSIDADNTWCITNYNVTPKTLQAALNYACGHGANCSAIQPDGRCYNPNNIYSHAAYAFNSYYVNQGKAPGSCDFRGAAKITSVDPSYGTCKYPSSKKKRHSPKPAPSPKPATGLKPAPSPGVQKLD